MDIVHHDRRFMPSNFVFDGFFCLCKESITYEKKRRISRFTALYATPAPTPTPGVEIDVNQNMGDTWNPGDNGAGDYIGK